MTFNKTHPFPGWARKSALAALGVLAALALAAFLYHQSDLQRGRRQQAYDVLETRLQNLESTTLLQEKRLALLEEQARRPVAKPAAEKTEKKTGEKTGSAPSANPVAESLTGLLSGYGAAPSPVGDPDSAPSRIERLEKEMKTLQAGVSASASTDTARILHLFTVFFRLNDKLVEGRPFATELAAFEEQASDDKTISRPLNSIAPYAETGIPTVEMLASSFDDLAASLSDAQGLPENAGWWDRLSYGLRHLVRVRKLHEASEADHSLSARLARIQDDLDDGKLDEAVAKVKELPEDLQDHFAGWLGDAQLLLELPGTLDALEAWVAERIAVADRNTPANGASRASEKDAMPQEP